MQAWPGLARNRPTRSAGLVVLALCLCVVAPPAGLSQQSRPLIRQNPSLIAPTPAPPVAPPQRLVVVGFYRYVRNPMYVGFFTGWAGLWIIFGRINTTALTVTATAVLGVALFVIFYEEPTLRGKFGSDYEEYCRNVRRWLPRLRPWT